MATTTKSTTKKSATKSPFRVATRTKASPAKAVAPAPRVSVPADLSVDVQALLWAGVEAGIREHRELEVAKRGVMRGASQGLLLSNGMVVGPCHRASLARMLGGEPPRPDDWNQKQLMFDSGHANEDSWFRNLTRSWRGPILREEEFPISWRIETPEGAEHHGTGREDIILCWPDGEAPDGAPTVELPDGRIVRVAHLIELKQISSVNTAVDVLFADGKPKLDHAIQVGRYTHGLDVPATIAYSLPFVCPIPNWSFLTPRIPAKGEPYSDRVDYGYDGRPSKIQPTVVCYRFQWHAGALHYCRLGEESRGWVRTIVTSDALEDYWQCTLDQPSAGALYPRPGQVDILGNPESWGGKSRCNWCDWKTVCDAHERDYPAWEAAVRETALPVVDTTMSKTETTEKKE